MFDGLNLFVPFLPFCNLYKWYFDMHRWPVLHPNVDFVRSIHR